MSFTFSKPKSESKHKTIQDILSSNNMSFPSGWFFSGTVTDITTIVNSLKEIQVHLKVIDKQN